MIFINSVDISGTINKSSGWFSSIVDYNYYEFLQVVVPINANNTEDLLNKFYKILEIDSKELERIIIVNIGSRDKRDVQFYIDTANVKLPNDVPRIIYSFRIKNITNINKLLSRQLNLIGRISKVADLCMKINDLNIYTD